MTFKACFGITSKTKDGKHIIILDYDNVELENVITDIATLQRNFNLSTFYIIESLHGFNAVCLDKLFLDIIKRYIENSIIDKDFLRIGYKRGYYALRIGQDKKYISDILNFNETQKSNAHRLFFNEMLKMGIPNDKLFDNETGLGVVAYQSKKHGYMEI